MAIKVIDVRSAKNEIEKMLIANEIRALSTVAHDNVIKCHEICQTVNNLYVVMDFCEQGSLSDFIKTHGRELLIQESLGRIKHLQFFTILLKGCIIFTPRVFFIGISNPRTYSSVTVFLKSRILGSQCLQLMLTLRPSTMWDPRCT